MRIDQVIPSLASRDAIGVHVVTLTNALREAGIDSDIFFGNCTPDVASLGHPLTALGRPLKDRWILYQSSIGSPVFDVVLQRPEPKFVNYHNITPAELLADWEPHVAFEVSLGRTQLERMAPESHLAVADSGYNEGELIEIGYTPTAVVPLLIEMGKRAVGPDQARSAHLRDLKIKGGADLMYVGKVSPHKAPHDLVKMLAVYRRLYDPAARLHLVGSPLGERYGPALEGFIAELGLRDAVFITGLVTNAELESYFEAADLYVSASDHEGFCVPIVEAMGHGVPVVAYGVTAVPETIGDAGLALPSKDPLVFATAVDRVVSDAELHEHLCKAGRVRALDFSLERSVPRFVGLLADAVRAA